jgi:putative restriction endonuclease
MRFFVAVTDNGWYRFLAEQRPNEVNFWRPSGGGFRAIEEGAPFLFKLHSPENYIAGGGFFVRYSVLPLSLAWEAFGAKNGAPSYGDLREQIARYRRRGAAMELDPQIGCIILAQPFFLEREDWIPVPPDWSRNIVVGKTYETESDGAELWLKVQERLSGAALPLGLREGPRYGAEYLVAPRLGQGTFRVLVTDAYQRRCAITAERTLPALEAAHIKPYGESGPHRVENGLLLRADLHRLLDSGHITVTGALRVEVSRRIKEDFENGRDYYALHGRQLQVLPKRPVERPSREFLEWHNQHCYLG